MSTKFQYRCGVETGRIYAYNIPFPGTGTRIKQLEETIEICECIWTMDKHPMRENIIECMRDELESIKLFKDKVINKI